MSGAVGTLVTAMTTEQSTAVTAADPRCELSRHAIFPECPQCGGDMHAEHAHYRCGDCGWRDSCCD